MALDINYLWEEKVSNRSITDMVYKIAHGDKDLYQEGLLGIRAGLTKNPDFTDDQLIREARWAMSHYRNRGVSIDNGSRQEYTRKLSDGTVKTYRKEIIPISIDAVMEEFRLEFPDYSNPPDILAMDRISAEKFYKSLNNKEKHFVKVCIEVLCNHFYSTDARRRLNISRNQYEKIKQSTYQKFIKAFGTDDDIQTLEAEHTKPKMARLTYLGEIFHVTEEYEDITDAVLTKGRELSPGKRLYFESADFEIEGNSINGTPFQHIT